MATIAADWPALAVAGTVAVTATTNDHVELLNRAIQQARLAAGDVDPALSTTIAGGARAGVGDWVVTRRNDRSLITSTGHRVHNRDLWTVEAVHDNGTLTMSYHYGHGTISVPADYTARHVRLGYAATEHGHQGDTVDVALTLASGATTHRGLYVAATRGRHHTASTSSPTPPTRPKPATRWRRCWPGTVPTSPPSPDAATSPARRPP